MTQPIPNYLSAQSGQTLREAIAELRALDHDVSEEVVSADLAHALEAHDAVHVLFGCDITDDDEVLAHVWMAAGTDAKMADMHEVTRDPDHGRYAKGFAHGQRLMVVLRTVPRILAVLWHARRMRQRWPFGDYERMLDRTLVSLRRDYGIVFPRACRRPDYRRGPHHPRIASRPA